MALVPWRKKGEVWDPFRDFERMRRHMNNIFDMSLSGYPQEEAWGPAIDLYEKDKKFVIKAEIPGIKKEDLELSVEDGMLTIKGEKKNETKKEEEGSLRKELYYGSFQRQVNLGQEVDENKAKASYKNGVLKVELPKKEEKEKRQRKIDIKEE